MSLKNGGGVGGVQARNLLGGDLKLMNTVNTGSLGETESILLERKLKKAMTSHIGKSA